MMADRREKGAAWAAVGLIGLLFLCAVFVAHRGPPGPAAAPPIAAGEAPPLAEPLVFAPIATDEAKKLNEAVPFAHDHGPAARAFAFAGPPESRERAVDCLASAMWYEAGGDARGQQAVAQVVLNRVRHPAYPGTVCGVVFQGSERHTGCQFTFTCDGALRRVPPPVSFAVTRERARAMLEGRVQAEVGLATHYHTDWVHPLWSARLDKIAQVDTHLFFRWSGVWGSSAAQRKPYLGGEPRAAALAFLSPFHRADAEATATGAADAVLPGAMPPPVPKPVDLGGGRFRVFLSAARSGNVQAVVALELCGTREYCKLTGMLDQPGAPGSGLGGRAPVVFVYLRNRAAGVERVMWDCNVFKRPTAAQCFGKLRDIPDARPVKPGATPSPGASESAFARP